MSEQITWLARFANGCLTFIALVSAECYFAGYILSKKDNSDVPQWIKILIKISLLHTMFMRNKKTSTNSSSGLSSGGVEMHSHASPSPSSTTSATESTLNPVLGGGNEDSGGSSIDHKVFSEGKENKEGRETAPVCDNEMMFSWERGRRALDRIARVVLPLAFVIFLIVFFTAKSKRL